METTTFTATATFPTELIEPFALDNGWISPEMVALDPMQYEGHEQTTSLEFVDNYFKKEIIEIIKKPTMRMRTIQRREEDAAYEEAYTEELENTVIVTSS